MFKNIFNCLSSVFNMQSGVNLQSSALANDKALLSSESQNNLKEQKEISEHTAVKVGPQSVPDCQLLTNYVFGLSYLRC